MVEVGMDVVYAVPFLQQEGLFLNGTTQFIYLNYFKFSILPGKHNWLMVREYWTSEPRLILVLHTFLFPPFKL